MPSSKKAKFLLFCSFLVFLFLVLGTNIACALEVSYPRVPGAVPPQDFAEGSTEALSLYIKYFFNLFIWVSGILIFFSLVVGGIRYLLSAGKPDAMLSAKEQISAAFFGSLILLSSFLILQALSPEFTVLEISEPTSIEEAEKPETTSLLSEEFRSSLRTELPFGKIIEEKILKVRLPEEKTEEKARMERIETVASSTLKIAEKLKKQSKELADYTKQCSCSQSDPCCEHPNPGTGCKDNACYSKPGCTCDPCKKVRNEIQNKEKENLKAIYQGIKIKETDASGKPKETTTSLREQQERAKKEIRLIKEEIGKLERVEIFMRQCPPWSLNSMTDFLDSKKYYMEKNWLLKITKFWDEIFVENDWATFYCPTSGTLWEERPSSYPSSSFTDVVEAAQNASPAGLPQAGDGLVACSTEIPVGELIDRTKRVGYKLIERMEKTISLSEQLIKAVNELHVLVSQCSSQGPSSDPPRSGCFSVCQKTLFACIKSCQGEPCPAESIEKKIKEIKDIVEGIPNQPAGENKKEKEGIKDVVEAKKKTGEEAIEDKERREQIGIIPIINEVVPNILKDLKIQVRDPMKKCISTEALTGRVLDCTSAIHGVGPEGILIKNCCYGEKWFQECFAQCYLEKNEDYKKCLKKCLEKKAEEMGIKDAADCRHLINFYCCTI